VARERQAKSELPRASGGSRTDHRRWVVRPVPWLVGVLLWIGPVFSQGWRVESVPFDWTDRTLTAPFGDHVLLLHGRDGVELSRDGTLRPHLGVLPMPVTERTAVAAAAGGRFWFCGGAAGRTFLINPEDWSHEEIPPLGEVVTRGARLAVREGKLYAIRGGEDRVLRRFDGEAWEALPGDGLLTGLGLHSAGLYSVADGIAAFGDHHVGWWDADEGRWRDKKLKVWVVLRLRPALGDGGMSAQDPATGWVAVTLGKGSRSLGLADLSGRRYFHLRPRLPGLLRHSGETLYVDGRGADRRLVVLSIEDRQRWSIPVASLERIAAPARLADTGSPWTVANAMPWGGHGELIRARDGLGNMVLHGPWVYTQRKNLLRRWNLKTQEHSTNLSGRRFGERWINRGAAMASDGGDRIFMITGWDRTLHVLKAPAAGPAGAADDLSEMESGEGPELPVRPSGNSAMVWAGDRLWAVLGPRSRGLFSWKPGEPAWARVADLPRDMTLDLERDLEVLAVGADLVLISGDRWRRFDLARRAWGAGGSLPFSSSADGGAAVVDGVSDRVWVVIGGGSRDLGLLDLKTGEARLLEDHLPDGASVYGRRLWVGEVDGVRALYLYRGHDSDELWRMPLE